jgi:hypothetical protein
MTPPPSLPPLSLRRAALELWKQKLGSCATYNSLIEVFERAGYKDFADVVRSTAGNVLYCKIRPLVLLNLTKH